MESNKDGHVLLPVTWEMCGMVSVPAASIEDAMVYFNENIDDIDLPPGEYVDSSFRLTDTEPENIELYQK